MKRILTYILLVICAAVSVGFLVSVGNVLSYYFPFIPNWTFVVILAGIIAPIMYSKWSKIRETDAMKYEHISILMHKFRTPITAIKWSIESIKSVDSLEQGKSYLDKIEKSSDTLIDLTDKMVSVSDVDKNEGLYSFEHCNCAKLIESIVHGFDEDVSKKKISLKLAIDPALPVTTIDIDKIRFVFEVLMKNAVHYTPEGGSIVISGVTGVASRAPVIIFQITDSGIGIIAEELPYIFRKFFRGEVARTLDVEGMGIGLNLAQLIIKRHNGMIAVASKGRTYGTTFTVTLPVV